MTQDLRAPELKSFSLSSYDIDLSNGDQIVTAIAQITDDISGVSDGTYSNGNVGYSQASWRSPSGQNINITFYDVLPPGTPLDGSYSDELFFSRFSENGVWTLDYFTVVDELENRKDYSTEELNALGIRTTLTVSGAVSEGTVLPETPAPTPTPTPTPTPPSVEEVVFEAVRSGSRITAQANQVDEIILAPKSFKTGKPDIIVGFNPQQDSLPIERDSFKGLTSNRLTVVATRKQIKQSNSGFNKTKLVYNSKNGQLLFDQNGRKEGLGAGGVIARLERLGDGRFPLLTSSDLPLI